MTLQCRVYRLFHDKYAYKHAYYRDQLSYLVANTGNEILVNLYPLIVIKPFLVCIYLLTILDKPKKHINIIYSILFIVIK